MHLKKLEIVGFKSFMEKTTLHFEPGITAVVGPNGCGKSNIFDSIRWVLGEQSAKALRGSQMEDVIFNGSDLKEPLGMAEVSLVFDNSKRLFSVDNDDVAITRRIFRSGESEYLLNKTQVRLKDIMEMLRGTGIGSEGYSLIEQGKIDLILSSRPEDRRLIFDEAAGITQYKIQKKEALRRLDETEQNLLRINDIVAEVKRQIGSLERQANKARRYKEAFEELKAKEVSLAVFQKNRLRLQKNESEAQLNQLESREGALLSTIKEQESKISSHQEELKTLEAQVTIINNKILSLDNLALRSKERIGVNNERIAELEKSKNYLETQIKQIKDKLIFDEERLNSSKKEFQSAKEDLESKSLNLKEKTAQLDLIASNLKASLERIAETKKNILNLAAASASVKNDISDSSAKQQIHSARKKRLELENAKINEERSVLEEDLNNIVRELDGAEKNYNELNVKNTGFKADLEKENLELAAINTELDSLGKQRFFLESQKEFLEKLKTKYEDIAESMNAAVYLDKSPSEKISGLVVKITDCVSSKSEETQDGGTYGFKLTGEAKPMDLDTTKVNEQIKKTEEKIEGLKNSKTERDIRIKEINSFIQEAEYNLRSQEIALVNKKASHKTISEQLNRIKEEGQIIALELSEVEQELSAIKEMLASLGCRLIELESGNKQAECMISEEQNSISLNSGLKEEALMVITQLKTEIETLAKHIDCEGPNLEIMQNAHAQNKENLANLQRQIQENDLKQESLVSEIKDLEDKIIQSQKELAGENNHLKETREKHSAVNEGAGEAIKKINDHRNDAGLLKNKLYELQMANKDLDFQAASIAQRVSQLYKIDLDTLPAQEKQQTEIEESSASEEIQKLKEKIDNYGTVNLVAIEEYDELKKRYDFLSQQQSDLLTAKESLHEAILKINRTTKKVFLETFEKIRAEFHNYFKLLFNGGDAQIFLIDEQDPLESGIEIICRPPGKKLQNVLLLSGGEKALSATALMFSIFRIKPAPFCVLDEIDAALDEANVDRFGRMLQEFASVAQFIVITHNKKTIANADLMYGITMQESGISKIVSVKFAKDKSAKESEQSETLTAEPAV